MNRLRRSKTAVRWRLAPSGFGLGLSIVAAVAAAHDATLEIAPGQGGGLCVEVRFPPADPDLLVFQSDDAEIVSQSR
jgi:signal transduction histidine kinase